ncbi:MAG: hypothetical protein ACRDDH_00005 [Cetobacterium sp.]|uniref:hypothetical protein n=1 Tax=Cetobacterium sp. TaxID=2071632 RepID=UPI003EE6EF18
MSNLVQFEILEKGINPVVKKNLSDAGFDILCPEDLTFQPNEKKTVNMKVSYRLPIGFKAKIEIPSSVADLHEIIALGGVCDHKYSGEIKAILKCLHSQEQCIKKGSKLIQFVVTPCYTGPYEITSGIFNANETRGLRYLFFIIFC